MEGLFLCLFALLLVWLGIVAVRGAAEPKWTRAEKKRLRLFGATRYSGKNPFLWALLVGILWPVTLALAQPVAGNPGPNERPDWERLVPLLIPILQTFVVVFSFHVTIPVTDFFKRWLKLDGQAVVILSGVVNAVLVGAPVLWIGSGFANGLEGLAYAMASGVVAFLSGWVQDVQKVNRERKIAELASGTGVHKSG